MKFMACLVACGLGLGIVAVGCGEDEGTTGGDDDGGTSSSSSSSGAGSTSSSGSSGGSSSSSGGGSSSGGSSSGGSSSGDGGSGDGGVTGDWAATCDDQAARAVECDPEYPLAEAKADCLEESTCYNAVYRPGAAAALAACLIARECGTGDDACYADTGAEVGGAATAAYVSACENKLAACEEEEEGFQDDYCGSGIGLAKDSLVAEWTACLESACGEVTNCLDAASVAAGCPDD